MAFFKNSVYFSLLLVFKFVSAKINVNVECGRNASDIKVTDSGVDVKIVGYEELKQFQVSEDQLKQYMKELFGQTPTKVYLTGPSPHCNLYAVYPFNKCQLKRILRVKSAEVMEITSEPAIVHSQDFENTSSNKIKVNTGISQSLETSITTSWSQSTGTEDSREVECGLDIKFFSISGSRTYSYTSNFGQSIEKTEKVTVGFTNSMETELNPGQACAVVLTANRGYINIKVTYVAYLYGDVTMYFSNKLNGDNYLTTSVDNALESIGKVNEKKFVEIIKIGFYTNASLKVYDKVSGVLL